ncbi:MAG: 50S ribosomal protein L21 [Fidelibacterota bacterium]|nr:MAG: 50S ribosomal protein L21 [Candidatus Neomarinimicrobiota bacterium]
MPEKKSNGYAIVDVGGKQFHVTAGQMLKVPLIEGEAGGNLQLDRVLAFNDGQTTQFGAPTVAGAVVDATILDHGREKKIIVFKFRRRKGYRRKTGHRQDFSTLRINGIKLTKPQAAPKPETEKKPAAVKETAKPAAKAAPRKTTAAKTTAKKAAPAKKTTTANKSTPAKAPAKTAKPAAPKKSAAAKKSTGAAKSTTAKSGSKKKTSE